ncbi:MAG: TA system VapC family ribonuclease toxin [Myxococcota bacterium]
MSRSVDVNILLYASDEGSEHHDVAKTLLASLIDDGSVLYLAWTTLLAYLRIATHPRVFVSPLSQAEAEQNVDALLRAPSVRCISESDRFWSVYRSVSASTPVRGNLVPDVHLATLLRQHGIRRLYTNDRDFLKFDDLEVVNPF